MGRERRPLEIANRQREARPRREDIRILVDHLFDREGESRGLGIAFVGRGTIRRLHREWMGEDSATDVLSFPYGAPVPGADPTRAPAGEVIVCVPVCADSALRHGIPMEEETARVLIHGALHVLGYEHATEVQMRRMRPKERRYLSWCLARGLRVVERR